MAFERYIWSGNRRLRLGYTTGTCAAAAAGAAARALLFGEPPASVTVRVPAGVGIYWTAHYLVTDRSALASQQGSVTLRSAVAIVLGILLVLELPQGLFRRLAGPFLRA